MAHDIFISYSHRDKNTADALCASLEGHGIRCWIAPRDVLPGEDWGEAIVNALGACRGMVLLLSSRSNVSTHVRNEVVSAASRGKIIIPFRIEDVQPSKALELYIRGQHWLDALAPPLERHLEELAATVALLLSRTEAGYAVEGEPRRRSLGDEGPPFSGADRKRAAGHGAGGKRVIARLAAALVVASVVLAVVAAVAARRGPSREGQSRAAFSPPVTSRDVNAVRVRVLSLAKDCMQDPSVVGDRRAELEELAKKVSSDPRYGEDAPGETAAIYRLCAASFLFAPTGEYDRGRIQQGLSWLRKLRALGPTAEGDRELGLAEEYFAAVAGSPTGKGDPYEGMRYVVRLALLGSDDGAVEEHARRIVERARDQNIYEIEISR